MKERNRIITKVGRVASWIKEKYWQVIFMLFAFMPLEVVLGADAKWNDMINFMLPWINRLGGVVMLIGAIEFGLAFKSDDAEGKTKGMRTFIAGAIVLAVGLSSGTFLYSGAPAGTP